MNTDTIAGDARNLDGKLTETAGALSGNESLQAEGIADQIGGKLQSTIGAARDALGSGTAPIVGQVKGFARDRPWAFGALAAVLGIALINTLRGKR